METEYEDIPYLDRKSVLSNPLQSTGLARNIFIRLWTDAGDLPDWYYVKKDWNRLDKLLFSQRKHSLHIDELETLFRRKWALSKEKLPAKHNEDDWIALKRIIEGE